MDGSFQIWNGWKFPNLERKETQFQFSSYYDGNSGFKLQVTVKTRSYSANPRGVDHFMKNKQNKNLTENLKTILKLKETLAGSNPKLRLRTNH